MNASLCHLKFFGILNLHKGKGQIFHQKITFFMLAFNTVLYHCQNVIGIWSWKYLVIPESILNRNLIIKP